MKVVHFIGSVEKTAGGTATYLQLLGAELKRSIEVVVVSDYTEEPIGFNGVKLILCDLHLSRWFELKKELADILRTERPDIVHINGIWNPQNWLFQKLAQQEGIKVILSPHGMLEPYILKRNPFKKLLAMLLYQKKSLESADYLHATAASELEQIRSLGFEVPGIIIPNGVDISEVKYGHEVVFNVKHFTILFLSRIHPKKGIELLIEAASSLKEKNFKISIAGEGEEEYIHSLKKLIKQKKMEERVELLGGIYGNEKWELYKKADLFVLPTYSENFGLVITEALAAGVPVITTSGTPWRELETENCGWWIDLSVDNLKKALEDAITMDPYALREKGERGRQLVKCKYDMKAVSKATLDFYHRVAGTPTEIEAKENSHKVMAGLNELQTSHLANNYSGLTNNLNQL